MRSESSGCQKRFCLIGSCLQFPILSQTAVMVPRTVLTHGLKYRFFRVTAGAWLVRHDNEKGKGDHRHYGNRQGEITLLSITRLTGDFDYACVPIFKNSYSLDFTGFTTESFIVSAPEPGIVASLEPGIAGFALMRRRTMAFSVPIKNGVPKNSAMGRMTYVLRMTVRRQSPRDWRRKSTGHRSC